MADSLPSSKTASIDLHHDRDPEAAGKVEDNISEKGSQSWEVTLDKNEDPKTIAAWRKWVIVLTISFGAMCVTCASSMVSVTQRIRSVGFNAFVPVGCFR